MTAATATNRFTAPAHSPQHGGIAVNPAIPVGSMELWRREAIKKVIQLGGLAQNWDSYGSGAPTWGVRRAAIDLLLSVPSEVAPAIVPVSGGGLHFEWSLGNKELEISIDADSRIETLKVENGIPLDDNVSQELSALFGWLAS